MQLAGPLVLIGGAGLIGSYTSFARQAEFQNALINTTIVIGLYIFIGNSGVVSFGHISFVGVGAYLAGLLTIDPLLKGSTMPALAPFLKHVHMSTVPSLALAAALGGVYAFLVGLPLMRLSGLRAGIATLAVLGITNNILSYWTKIGPGAQALSNVPAPTGTTEMIYVTAGAGIAVLVAFAYQRSRAGRKLRATREDPAAARASGIDIYRQRILAFMVSGAITGFAGGLLVHFLGVITAPQVYLDLTLITLAMLVVGGVSSLWGAVVGGLAISALSAWLGDAENGDEWFAHATAPPGTRLVALGAVMALVLILKPSGLTGGRELSLPRLRRRPKPEPAPSSAS